MSGVLETKPFRQPWRARSELAAILDGLPAAIQGQLEMLLLSAADPDSALHYLASLKQQKPDVFGRLAQSPSGLKYLIAVFSHSRFLSDEILQTPQGIEQPADMNRVLSALEYKKRLGKFLKLRPAETPNALSLA